MVISQLCCPDDRHLGSGLMGAHFLLNKTANKAPKSPETQRPESWSGSTQASAKFKGYTGTPKGHDSHEHQKKININPAKTTFLSTLLHGTCRRETNTLFQWQRNKLTLAVRRSWLCSSVWRRAGVASSRCRDWQRSESSSRHSEPQLLASKLLKTSFRRSS